MSKKFLTNIDMDSNKIENLASPSADADATNKLYVDSVARGLKYKAVRARTTGNITIASDLNATDVIDGVTLADGDLVLVDNQSTAADDGIYTVGAVPARATGPNGLHVGDDATGLAVSVAEGIVNGNKTFVQTAEPAIVGTDGLTFGQLGGAGTTLTAGAGITDVANTWNVVATDTSLTVNANDVAVNLASDPGLEVSSGLRVKLDGATLTRGPGGMKVTTPVDSTVARVATTAGPASSATSYVFNHNLGKQWVVASCYLISTEEEVEVDVTAADTNNTTFTFATSVMRSDYRFVVAG